ncbi:uncharacterized protein LOC112637952 [Camponotus floridanus]|uniref:uncharacterized protein LOC112637952 n=1 Tax=Camponotus floridanus TaxID=104421 RepID=UPI000DC67965|nr:uncharacterized protein LOC112637952 [Camponotus floridanus]
MAEEDIFIIGNEDVIIINKIEDVIIEDDNIMEIDNLDESDEDGSDIELESLEDSDYESDSSDELISSITISARIGDSGELIGVPKKLNNLIRRGKDSLHNNDKTNHLAPNATNEDGRKQQRQEEVLTNSMGQRIAQNWGKVLAHAGSGQKPVTPKPGKLCPKATEKVLGENATVRSKTPEVDLEIKDLDEITTKEEILEALQRDLGTDCGVTLESVRSLRNGYGGTKTAAVRLAAPTAKKLLERTHIRVPWTDCSVREVIRPLKFYTCWHFGHLYKNCKSRVDRSKSCIKCGVVAGAQCIHGLYRRLLANDDESTAAQPQPLRGRAGPAYTDCAGAETRSGGIANRAESGFVRVKVKGIHFYSCYAPPSLTTGEFENLLDRLVEDAKGLSPVAIAGDFNAWAVDWGSNKTTEKGQVTSGGHVSPGCGLAEHGLAGAGCRWEVTDTYTGSDHQVILWEIRGDRGHDPPPPRTNAIGWKTGMFGADLFREALDAGPPQGKTATEKVEEVMRRVTDACDATMLRKPNIDRRPLVHWWSDQIAGLRRECNRTRRVAQRARSKPTFPILEEKHKEARRKLNSVIKQSKTQSWRELLREVDADPWGRPYKAVMTRLKSQPMPAPSCPVLMEKIVSTLFPEQPEQDYHLEEDVDEEIPPIMEEELLAACARVGNNKAPDLDGIPNIALKTATKAAPGMFLDMYNTCLKEGLFPERWKWQRLVLSKGKKPPDEPSSYRPLCMLDTVGKIFERILHDRIEAIVERLLSDRQYGYRKNRSTLDALNLVVNTAKEAISGKRWKREDDPRWYRVTEGVPQGSVLGPLLWIIMYDALLRLLIPLGVLPIAFADNLALVIIAKFLEELVALFGAIFPRIRG